MTAFIIVVLVGGIIAAIAYTVSKKSTTLTQKPLPVAEDPIESPGKPDEPELVIVDYITPEVVLEEPKPNEGDKSTPEVYLEAPKTKTPKLKTPSKSATKTATKKTSKKVTKK